MLHPIFFSGWTRSCDLIVTVVHAALRSHGFASLHDVGAVILEADGSFSVIQRLAGDCSALSDVPELGSPTRKTRRNKLEGRGWKATTSAALRPINWR